MNEPRTRAAPRSAEDALRARVIRMLADVASRALRCLANALDDAGDTPNEAMMMAHACERIAETYR